MRPDQSNPLDLNNLPEDYSRDGKLVFDDSSSSAGYRKKKSGGKDGKDECGKVYECRFCSLKFCKSQALGGHMNRHRQERETETLNRARQLVFSSDNLAAQAPHLGCHPMGPGSYHPGAADPFRSVYPPRLFSASSSTVLPPTQPPHHHHHQPYLYTSPSRLPPYSSQYNSGPHQPINDYYIGHVLGNNHYGAPDSTNYTCIGAPVGGGFGPGSSRGSEGSGGGGRDGSISNQEEGSNWGRSYAGGGSTQHQRLDSHSSINRFQDGF